jgi:hypothetical protein
MVLASCHHSGAYNFQAALRFLDNLCASVLIQFIEIRNKKIVMRSQVHTQAK